MRKNLVFDGKVLRRRAVVRGLNARKTAFFLRDCFKRQGRDVRLLRREDSYLLYASRKKKGVNVKFI